ncbi:hypothetical protein ABID20_001018 [Rhizobium alvei]
MNDILPKGMAGWAVLLALALIILSGIWIALPRN